MVKRLDPQHQNKVSIVYYSQTGQTQRFIEKLREKIDIHTIKLEDGLKVDEQYILLTPTYMFGEVPKPVVKFLEENNSNMTAVMASGNKNWGGNFAKAGDIVSSYYNVDLIGKYELAGTSNDIDTLIKYIERM